MKPKHWAVLIALGVVYLNEELSWWMAVGALLIFASILVVNWKTK